MNDARGYSYVTYKAIRAADPKSLGVQLGLFCIEHNIPAARVADDIGVSRHSVYSWFTGRFRPTKKMEVKIMDLLNKYRDEAAGLAKPDEVAV